MGKNYIKQLTVGGFQVFADPVTFPLGPLTLLYGPNSAGKSAILDAMLALADLCELRVPAKSTVPPNGHRIHEILGRHWRRQGIMPTEHAELLQLGAMIRVGGYDWAKAGFAVGELFEFGPLVPKFPKFERCFPVLRPLTEAEHVDVEVLFRYQIPGKGIVPVAHPDFAQEQRIEISLDGSQLLQFCGASDWVAINLDHEALVDWSAATDLKWMAQNFEDTFAVEGGWFSMNLTNLIDGWLYTNSVDYIGELLASETERRVRDAKDSFISMFEALFHASLRSMAEALRVSLVPASRTVPDRADVTFLFTADGTPMSSETFGLQVNGLPQYLAITNSAFFSELERCGLLRPSEGLYGKPVARPSTDPIDLVNRLLGDYLFRSSGYFVAAGIHQLTPLGMGGVDNASLNKRDAGQKFLASLELRDFAGRRFHFDEVGSGLGYVLPVLLAVAASDTAFLQQPELHLHPALQSELADALIAVLGDSDFGGSDSSGCSQIIAETHSEHLLLRLLKRVRQAADLDRSLDPHSLGREDLVVLYVDPQPDGTSTVKHLRIARDGEFIDRWPRGFFEERWGDLFDE